MLSCRVCSHPRRFTGLALALPSGARFETAMQWGHIGWALPAAFGYGVGAPDRRVLVLIGDGAIQVPCSFGAADRASLSSSLLFYSSSLSLLFSFSSPLVFAR